MEVVNLNHCKSPTDTVDTQNPATVGYLYIPLLLSLPVFGEIFPPKYSGEANPVNVQEITS